MLRTDLEYGLTVIQAYRQRLVPELCRCQPCDRRGGIGAQGENAPLAVDKFIHLFRTESDAIRRKQIEILQRRRDNPAKCAAGKHVGKRLLHMRTRPTLLK